MHPAARCVFAVAPLDPLHEVTKTRPDGRFEEGVVGGAVVELEEFEIAADLAADDPEAGPGVITEPAPYLVLARSCALVLLPRWAGRPLATRTSTAERSRRVFFRPTVDR